MRLYNQDNREALKELADNSVDSIVTDPPYGLSFMNKKWDYDVPSVDFWREVYRVLKPGGHILSFGGTRTYHRMVVNIEDAGFEIRDQIQWIYGSGFPKSLNVGKAVDKIEGNEREVVGTLENYQNKSSGGANSHMMEQVKPRIDINITKGQTEYEGWGSALKPANEPIVLARKPLSEKSISENVLSWRTGGLNIHGCRIGYEAGSHPKDLYGESYMKSGHGKANTDLQNISGKERNGVYVNDTGRFPANVILECICDEGDIHTNPDCSCYIMDEQSGVSKSTKMKTSHRESFLNSNDVFGIKNDGKTKRIENFGDSGGASRFFYRAKVSKKERNLGLDGFDEKENKTQFIQDSNKGRNMSAKYQAFRPARANTHPTVKPINLLTYLCRLITPPKGVVLDPFMGSGSTGVAALLEGFDFIGMELEKDYYEIAKKRIEKYQLYKNIIK